MNTKISLDFNTLGLLYKKYRDFIVPGLVILVCIILFFQLIIPQILNLAKTQEEVKREAIKLDVLRGNLSFLTNLNQDTLDSQFIAVSSALPPGKDFAGILNSISSIANLSGVAVGEFEFQVGDLDKAPQSAKAYPSLDIVINITGGLDGASSFMKELYKSVPLAEVKGVKLNDGITTLTLTFYYKPYPPIGFNDTSPIRTITQQELDLIRQFETWSFSRINSEITISPEDEASASSEGQVEDF